MTSPWEVLAERQIVAPRKARMRAAETRRQKKLKERDTLFRAWKKWHEERREQFLQHDGAAELVALIERMTLDDGDALIDLVEHSPLRHADQETRSLALSLINNGIIYLRESNGLVPFDDPLPDEEPSAFFVVKEMLTG
jgi:hypothetical protein